MKKLQLFIILVLITLAFNAQDIAMNSSNGFEGNMINIDTDYSINPLLSKNKYTYRYKGDDVLVVFSGNVHIEYFNNKKHFIKSNVNWVSVDECFMTIKESNLPNFPFKVGTKLRMKILKIKRGYIYYESTLGGRSWTGKMKKVD